MRIDFKLDDYTLEKSDKDADAYFMWISPLNDEIIDITISNQKILDQLLFD